MSTYTPVKVEGFAFTLSGHSRWWRKLDRASYAMRNNHNRGNRRRYEYWSKKMRYLSGRACGFGHARSLIYP